MPVGYSDASGSPIEGPGGGISCMPVGYSERPHGRLTRDRKWGTLCMPVGYGEGPHVRHLVGYLK